MTFKPGQSGNPAGRPPGSRSVETLFRDAIKKIAEDQKIEDVERELVITLLAKAKKGDMRALEMYLDRLYGKPKQHTDITTNGESINPYNTKTSEELLKMLDATK
ncbi:MAG TPA: DUF5681 domain-containing protein [Candidatus Absconditabacterales bacterium]|nr:DUF5681 domain-containing protein [Candidatus Absconditabacterales bacterium]